MDEIKSDRYRHFEGNEYQVDNFLECSAISRTQYEESFRDLTDKFLAQEREQSEARLDAGTYAEQKMGMQDYGGNEN